MRYIGLVGWFLNVFNSNKAILQTGPQTEISQIYMLTHRDRAVTSISAGHIILTPT